MKLQRWDYQHLHGDFLIRRDDGDWCACSDIARLEALHAQLMHAAKEMIAWWDYARPNESAQEYIDRLSAAIAKAEGDTPYE